MTDHHDMDFKNAPTGHLATWSNLQKLGKVVTVLTVVVLLAMALTLT